jgi:repressor LexA
LLPPEWRESISVVPDLFADFQLVEEISSTMVEEVSRPASPSIARSGADPRAALVALARERGDSLSALSAILGRNRAYLGQYANRGTPKVLPERERRLLADHLGVAETMLGAEHRRDASVRLPRLDVAASAGPGATVDCEVELGAAYLPAELISRLGLREGSVVRVRGTSMEPGLLDGDQIVVDTAQRAPGGQGSLFVIRVDGLVMVKRVRRGQGRLIASSDNPDAPPVPGGAIEVIGRVVWQMRAPR